jgi:hypothetical protein
MDADPWADAPPSPRPGSAPTSPAKATTSPLAQSEPFHALTPPPEETPSNGGLDDFDDFDEPAAGPSAGALPDVGGDDGFGDFGDFEEGEFTEEPIEAGPSVPLNVQKWVSRR